MFLLSTNIETSVNQVLKTICEITGTDVKPEYTEKLPADLRRMKLSYEKAKNAFNYSPKFSLMEGIQRYVNWYRSRST